jgi:hypothetical protein
MPTLRLEVKDSLSEKLTTEAKKHKRTLNAHVLWILENWIKHDLCDEFKSSQAFRKQFQKALDDSGLKETLDEIDDAPAKVQFTLNIARDKKPPRTRKK